VSSRMADKWTRIKLHLNQRPQFVYLISLSELTHTFHPLIEKVEVEVKDSSPIDLLGPIRGYPRGENGQE